MWTRLFDQAVRKIITRGCLDITLPDGSNRRYGDGSGPTVRITLTDPELPKRIVMNPDLAVGEGYMEGTLVIENDDLDAFLALAIRNNTAHNHSPVWWLKLANRLRRMGRVVSQWNPVGKAKDNVAHHYDLSGALYDLFLDRDKQYSCAYFSRPGMSLEDAQAAKKAHIAGKLLLEPGMRVLDIGCGWGGMALTLARDYGVHVLGVTLSEEQHKIATMRAREEGLDHLVEFRLVDYRNVHETFDRIVSVGMFEHVGAPHYREYFRHVHDKLKPDGIALIHTIGRSGPPGATGSWLSKYIFPGGYVPAMSEMMAAVEKEELWATDVEVWRNHYAETLRHWHDRFMANRDKALALYDERFCRMWRYYLKACEMSFRHAPQVVFHVQLAHDKNAVPFTRDYLYRGTPQPARRAYPHAAE